VEKIMNTETPSDDPIKHVILLILENHSFDQMLGCFQELFPDLDGVDKNNLRSNKDVNGNIIYQSEMRETQMVNDPMHEHSDVMEQIADGNSGFVKNFAKHYPKSSLKEREAIMGYYPLDYLPSLHTLARNFTICDNWFCSFPGSTWANRFFALSGTCSGNFAMLPAVDKEATANIFSAQSQDTIFDRLEEAKKKWGIFYYDIASSLILKNMRKPEMSSKYQNIDEFFHLTEKSEAEFPDFVFIEPKYFGLDQNDDHPPHNVMKAQKLVADVYNAIRSNEDLWNSSLFVLYYDEHGGFYDHVTPPKAVPPDKKTEKYSFDQYGVRVPALLISPWVKHCVEKTEFDHTSLLKYLCDKWNMPPLTARSDSANSIRCAIGNEIRKDTPQFIRIPYSSLIPKNPEWELADASKHHNAFGKIADIIINDAEGIFGESAELLALRAAVKSENLWLKLKSSIGIFIVRIGYRWSKLASNKAEEKAHKLTNVLKGSNN
jgi:phospholipase C